MSAVGEIDQSHFTCLGHKLWQTNEILPDIPPGRPNLVQFEFHVRYKMRKQHHQVYDNNDDDYVMVDFCKLGVCSRLDNLGRFCYPYMFENLRDFDVPEKYLDDTLFPAIVRLAKQMENDPHNAHQSLLGMFVMVDIFTTPEQNEYQHPDVSPIIRRRRNLSHLQSWRKLPPTPNFERVRVGEEAEVNSACAICLDKCLVGDETAKLGCYHVYHWHCIVEWLYISNVCPLCRHPHSASGGPLIEPVDDLHPRSTSVGPLLEQVDICELARIFFG